MQKLLDYVGSAAGVIGVLLCAVAGFARITGEFYVADYQATTLFMVGIGIMVFACMAKLQCLVLLGRMK